MATPRTPAYGPLRLGWCLKGQIAISHMTRSQLSRHNSQNFQSCLDKYRQLAALVNEELGRDRIDWALKIRPWRNEQRRLIGRLTATGGKASPYFTFLRKWLTAYTVDTKDLFLHGGGQRIYVRVNPFFTFL